MLKSEGNEKEPEITDGFEDCDERIFPISHSDRLISWKKGADGIHIGGRFIDTKSATTGVGVVPKNTYLAVRAGSVKLEYKEN